ncbi:hypothetical protein SDRG_03594 [Saprolegnia diclina VS20]|uniref:Uncharacterized protein n=1 Tax=Saprolegnia diclina (strain VS20) TaxID=1156394 RepID=T0S9I7_SAPDV|nr:hypothetical protein SDRG_03594 [Saprolegnia diclina VS20]EQC39392.1 hypothetical protein SDRG_03594 [Saprolegnia diclina VS20]|eukprot:XP_008607453.1 hypothetical protein SDRG_03594 [Saprolegnia diclina VS20]
MSRSSSSSSDHDTSNPVDRINHAIERLDWTSLGAVLEVPGNPGYRLCPATEADFETYVAASEFQELRSRYLILNDGFLFIVEMPSGLHVLLAGAVADLMTLATGYIM